jgi:hypothetical protein
VAILIIWKYDVTEEKAHEIREALVLKRELALQPDEAK